MTSVAASVSPVPSAAIYCKAQTRKAGQVVAVGVVARWLVRPTATPQGWTGARLILNGSSYDAECTFAADGDTGIVFQVIDLRTWDGKSYRVILGHTEESCDCPHASFTGCVCKHLSGVKEALAQLEALERAEWEQQVAQQAVADASVPF